MIREAETIRFLVFLWHALDERCEQLTEQLGYSVGRSQVLEDLARRAPDKELRRLVKKHEIKYKKQRQRMAIDPITQDVESI